MELGRFTSIVCKGIRPLLICLDGYSIGYSIGYSSEDMTYELAMFGEIVNSDKVI